MPDLGLSSPVIQILTDAGSVQDIDVRRRHQLKARTITGAHALTGKGHGLVIAKQPVNQSALTESYSTSNNTGNRSPGEQNGPTDGSSTTHGHASCNSRQRSPSTRNRGTKTRIIGRESQLANFRLNNPGSRRVDLAGISSHRRRLSGLEGEQQNED
ncbi:hypothetical protein D3C72_983860 [compost metagenome]